METFQHFNLPKKLQLTLKKMSFKEPTEIQAQTIPLALDGVDILGTAQTGTGKTGAFGIPLVAKVLTNDTARILVLTPTRELAMQVLQVFQTLLSDEHAIGCALLIGGDAIDKQLKHLRRKPRIVIGTPGRINDHLKRGTLNLAATQHLVLDETDLMLDMGFDVQISTIIQKLPKNRQTLMFSATLPSKIERLAGKYLIEPKRISARKTSTQGAQIQQEVLAISDHEKYDHLLDQLETREGSSIIFVRTKRGADKLSTKLNNAGFISGAIHGDLRQNKRSAILKAFRNKKYTILVATDVAARGIDVPHIQYVINYDLPQCPEDYTHRIGRTGRAGKTGTAISFVTHKETKKWQAMERLLDPTVATTEARAPHKKSFPKNRKQSTPSNHYSGNNQPTNNKRFSKSNHKPNKKRQPAA